MKHSPKITIILLTIFLLTQFLGLAIVYKYIDPQKSIETGQTEFKDLPLLGERPPVQEQFSYIHVMIIIIIGTIIMLGIIKYKLNWLWKGWYLLAVITTLIISFSALSKLWIAIPLAFILAIWKIFRPNVIVHNLTEIFVYGGLAAIFVSWFNIWSVSILLVLIAIYDAYAVWKSKHMITLAKSQAQANVFAGLLIPYRFSKAVKKTVGSKLKPKVALPIRTAILGGGDLGFPLIFAGVVLKEWGLSYALLIPPFACLGLALLLWFSQEKKFYPAMPFIGAGCFLGLGLAWLIRSLI